MTWFKVDDKLWGHPKWLGLSKGARALWVTAGSWAASNLTDGWIPDHALKTLGGRTDEAAALVTAGMWRRCDGGWQFHDWDQWQPSRASVEARSKASAERVRRFRSRSSEQRTAQSSTDISAGQTVNGENCNGVTSALVTPLVTLPPTRPDPTRPEEQEQTLLVNADAPTTPTPKQATKPKRKLRPEDLDNNPAFQAFWHTYPRKVAKGTARTAWIKAITRTTPDTITTAAARYARAQHLLGTPPDKIAHPATWLNADRWTDEEPTQPTNHHTTPGWEFMQ